MISVVVTLVEFAVEAQYSAGSKSRIWQPAVFFLLRPEWLRLLNDAITAIFVVELTLRYLCAASKRYFFRMFWLDILATLPLFRIFRAGRALRLLRLIRVLRLFGLFSRLSSHYPYVFRRGAFEFLFVCGLIGLAVIFGTVSMMYFETSASADSPMPNDDQFTLENSFWFSIYTLLSGEPTPSSPDSLGGRLTSLFIMFMGLTIFAIFAGTVSAFMVDRIRVEETVFDWDEIHDHTIICGWSSKTEIIIREFQASAAMKPFPIIVIGEIEHELLESLRARNPKVIFVNDDFTKVSALQRVRIEQASRCIILSDNTGGRNEQDADARTILAALTVEKISPDVYTCAELMNRNYASHLDMGKVNAYVVSGEHSAHMLAQGAMNRGLLGVLDELLSCQRGNEFYRVAVPDSWFGKSFSEMLRELKRSHNAILIGVHSPQQGTLVNPAEYSFQAGDELVAICDREIEL